MLAESPGVVFDGELDSWNADAVASALQKVDVKPGADFHLDLSRVRFCDVSGMRILITSIERLGEQGPVVLVGLDPRLERLFNVVGWGPRSELARSSRPNGSQPMAQF